MSSCSRTEASIRAASAKSEQANSLADEYDKSFSKIVSQEIANYRSLEKAWQTAGACAKLAFDPPSGALQPLAKGQAGQVTGHVVANSDGGTARPGRWTVVGAENGTITPASAAGAMPAFVWTVTNTGEGIKLRGDFKATSTAGVASGAWTQPTKHLQDVVRIVGTFSGSLDWDRWRRPRALVVGRQRDLRSAPHLPARRKRVLSAGRGLGDLHDDLHRGGCRPVQRCSAQGSATKQLTEGDGGWLVMTFADDGLSPPYEYSGSIDFYSEPGQMAVTLSACPDPDRNGTTELISLLQPLSAGSPDGEATSPDGLIYTGTWAVEGPSSFPVVWHWDFHGETM